MRTGGARVEALSWARCVLASVVGWVIGGSLSGIVCVMWLLLFVCGFDPGSCTIDAVTMSSLTAVWFACMGIGLGVAQMRFLRGRLKMRGWGFAYALGFAVVGAVFGGEHPPLRRPFPLFINPGVLAPNTAVLLAGVIGGTITGVVQWLILRRQVQQSNWLVLTSVLVSALGTIIAFAGTDPRNPWPSLPGGSNRTRMIATMIWGATITSRVLIWLVQTTAP